MSETFSPLMDSIIEREKITVVDANTIDDFARENGDTIILCCGDHKRLVEVNDAAVILPELVKSSNGALTCAVVERASEREFQRRYRFSAFPAMVFLREGEYLGVITRVLDWSDYVSEINAILAREPSDPPPFKLPGGHEMPKKVAEKSLKDSLIDKGADNV